MPELRRRWTSVGLINQFICDGKSVVLDVYQKVRRKVDKISRTLFFIDKDIDDFIGVKHPRSRSFFVTKYYSIENYLVSEKVFSMIWTDIFHLELGDPRFSVYLSKYKECYKIYNSIMTPVMAWIIYERRIGGKPMLNEIHLKK